MTTFEGQGGSTEHQGAEGPPPPMWQTYWGVVAGAGAGGAKGTGGQGGQECGPGSRAKPLSPLSDCVIKMLQAAEGGL